MNNPRLNAIARIITAAGVDSVIDIGTDHALLPIHLVKTKAITKALATDIAKGPLTTARANIERHNMEKSIQTMQAAGLEGLPEGYNALVIAGMGGRLIMSILKGRGAYIAGFKRVILGPQRDVAALRAFCHSMGLKIVDEILIHDKGHYYNVLELAPGHEEPYSQAGYALGQRLIDKACPVLNLWLVERSRKIEGILPKLNTTSQSYIKHRAEYAMICQILEGT